MKRLLLVASLCAFSCGGGGNSVPPLPQANEAPSFVGSAACADCHATETSLWRGSHHDRAMEEATPQTVLGDFDDRTFEHRGVTSTFYRRDDAYFVRTDGPDGVLTDYQIAYTFGVEPLQQYLIAFPNGRYQALSLAWDTKAERWFHLYPDEPIDHEDPLHWTKRRQSWNLMCADCHSTGLEKDYDFETDSYATTWEEIDVACEACHGPASQHVAWAETEPRPTLERLGLVVTLGAHDDGVWVMNVETGLSKRVPPRTSRAEIETCARCHARRSAPVADYEFGRPLLDTYRLALLNEPLYYADGQIRDEVYVYGSFTQSKMYREGVTCQDCHDPHSLSVRAEGNGVCAACHATETFDTPAHHHHEVGSEATLCVSCHMTARTYMVVDPRRDHSFRVPRPAASASSGSPNACNRCHEDQTPSWAEAHITQWRGDDPPPAALEPAPAIVRATVLAREPFDAMTRDALRDDDPLVRLAAASAADMLAPPERHQLVLPLLRDDVRLVRQEAARALSSVPRALFTPEQWSELSAGIDDYRRGQERNADWPESHLNLGLIHVALGELTEAEASYRTAIRIDPDITGAYVNLADVYRTQGRETEAEAVLRDALTRNPEQPEILHVLGLTLVRTQRTSEAIDLFRRAAEGRPEEARYAYVYGVALNSTGEGDHALEVLEAASERHPRDRDILVALATIHRDRGNAGQAVAYARRLVALTPDDPSAKQFLTEMERGSR